MSNEFYKSIKSKNNIVLDEVFYLDLLDENNNYQEVKCILHKYEIYFEFEPDSEQVGYMTIKIGDRDYIDITIWGGSEDEEYYDCYVCLPTLLEDNNDDELEVYCIGSFLRGII